MTQKSVKGYGSKRMQGIIILGAKKAVLGGCVIRRIKLR